MSIKIAPIALAIGSAPKGENQGQERSEYNLKQRFAGNVRHPSKFFTGTNRSLVLKKIMYGHSANFI